MTNTTGDDTEGGIVTGRRAVLTFLGAVGATAASTGPALAGDHGGDSSNDFDPIEESASELRARYLTGEATARSVVEAYLERIWEYEDELEAIITVNPDVFERAEELDRSLATDGPVGPLHGVPILVKDNHDTADMTTTAGSVSLMNSIPPNDAAIVEMMREAGGVILAKANLHEFAFGYDTVSSLGGVTHNPYDLDRYAGGSSGGTGAGIAANLGTIGIGTDTGGSVRVPAAACNLVGLRPSTGLVSRDGIVPLSLTEDTAGPMTRTVGDAALLTDVIAGYDSDDPETAESVGRTPHAEGKSYTDYLNEDGLNGARIGVYPEYVGPTDDIEDQSQIRDARRVKTVFEAALEDMERLGATIIPVEAPPDDLISTANVNSGAEFNRDINQYLSTLKDGPATLAEIVRSDEYAPAICETIREREDVDEDALDQNLEYLRELSKRDDLQQLVLSTMAEETLDAIVYPTIRQTPPRIQDENAYWGSNAQLAPALEFPAMTVPAGFTEQNALPVGIEFLGREFQEAVLFELAYSYEQMTRHRRSPADFGPVEDSIADWSVGMIEDWNDEQHRNRTVEALGYCE